MANSREGQQRILCNTTPTIFRWGWCGVQTTTIHMHAFQAHEPCTPSLSGSVQLSVSIPPHCTCQPGAVLHVYAVIKPNKAHHTCTALLKTAAAGAVQPSRLPPGQDSVSVILAQVHSSHVHLKGMCQVDTQPATSICHPACHLGCSDDSLCDMRLPTQAAPLTNLCPRIKPEQTKLNTHTAQLHTCQQAAGLRSKTSPAHFRPPCPPSGDWLSHTIFTHQSTGVTPGRVTFL